MTCRGDLSSRWFRFGFRMLNFCADLGLAAFAVKHHLLRVQVELPHQLPDRGPDAAGGQASCGVCATVRKQVSSMSTTVTQPLVGPKLSIQ